MDALDMLEAHRYPEAMAAFRERLAANPEDWPAVGGVANVFAAARAYADAIPWLWRLDTAESKDSRSGLSRIKISCFQWCLKGRLTATCLATWTSRRSWKRPPSRRGWILPMPPK